MQSPRGHNEVTASIWVQFTWRRNNSPNPLSWQSAQDWKDRLDAQRRESDAFEEELRRAGFVRETVNEFHERFGTARRVREARKKRPAEPAATWPGWYEARDMIAIAMGAPEPRWMNGTWWHERSHYPLAQVESKAELARFAAPDWARLDIVRRMLDSRARWQNERPDEPLAGFGLTWEMNIPGRAPACTFFYPSFVDLGVYLMGMTHFLTVLAGEPELADALMDLCFDLSTGYTEFLFAEKSERFEGLGGFGGDATFSLSPALYPRYGAAWDARLFDYARARHNLPADVPCNLHSCGASSHLYELWGNHPCGPNITTLQTRLVPGEVKRLRQSLPNVQLELTLHPPQFELATATPEQVREVLLASARDAGFRDAHLGFIVGVRRPDGLPHLMRNIKACSEAMEEIRACSG